MVARCADGECR